jgi:hypothetical protein
MNLKYQSGQEIVVGDRVLFHGEPAEIELVALPASTDPEHEWYVKEFGGGVGIREAKLGRTFISADQLPETEDLEFVSRRIEPGGTVMLMHLPPGFLDDLPLEEQRAIREVLGRPVRLRDYKDDGKVELEFTDVAGVMHVIYVTPDHITPNQE